MTICTCDIVQGCDGSAVVHCEDCGGDADCPGCIECLPGDEAGGADDAFEDVLEPRDER